MEPDEHLSKLIQHLGVTINNVLSDSPEIREAIGAVREAGYDVFLVLEATIGLNPRAAPEAGGEEIHLKVNAQDMKFLRSLKIRVDDLESK